MMSINQSADDIHNASVFQLTLPNIEDRTRNVSVQPISKTSRVTFEDQLKKESPKNKALEYKT